MTYSHQIYAQQSKATSTSQVSLVCSCIDDALTCTWESRIERTQKGHREPYPTCVVKLQAYFRTPGHGGQVRSWWVVPDSFRKLLVALMTIFWHIKCPARTKSRPEVYQPIIPCHIEVSRSALNTNTTCPRGKCSLNKASKHADYSI